MKGKTYNQDYPASISFTFDGEIKSFTDKQKLKEFSTTKSALQQMLKEISPRCSLEGLMLELKLQYFGHLMRRDDSSEKTLMLGKIEGRKRRGLQRIRCWMHHQLNGHGFGWTLGVTDGQGDLACRDSRGRKESVTELSWIEWDVHKTLGQT